MAGNLKGVSNRLEQLASRLVNVTRANKSIRLLRKAKQQCFDVAEVHPLRGAVAADLLKKVLHGKSCVVLSHRDSPVDPRDDRYELLIDEKNTLEEVETPEFKLVRLFRKLDSNLTQLSRKANWFEAETGASDLYVGYPWLTGNCDDTEGTFLQAPLMLFPVRLTAQRSPRLQWLVEPREDAEPIFNEALGLALEQFHHTKLSEEFIEEAEAEAESEAVADDPSRLLRWFQERFSALGIRLTEPDEQIRVLQEFKSEFVPRMTAAFTIRAHVVVGYFPQADSSLRRDYEALIPLADQGQLGDVLSRLMDSSAQAPAGDGMSKQSMDEVPEDDTCWIVDSDASQEAAMLRSRTEPCLVVHGPPGTGKSQVICNLITDALSKGQRVLVCCQKRAALDVVFQRLESAGLGANVAVVHDHSNDRQALYERIAKALEPELAEGVDTHDQVQKLARTIDETTQVLKQVAEELFKPRRCGATARQLYAMALGVREDIDPELSRVAGRFQLEGLDKFLGTLQRLREFHARLGDRASAWSGRMSFAQLTFADRARIEAALKRVAEATQTLLRAEKAIGTNRPNASQIAPHVELMTGLGAAIAAQADENALTLAGVLMDGTQAGAARAALEASQKLLEQVRSLPPRPGADFLGGPIDVAVALETYNAKRRSLFRAFSSSYRTAKRSTQAYLTREAAPDTPEVVRDQAALIRSQNLWARIDRAVEGTALGPYLAGVRVSDELARRLATAQVASQLASKFRDAATSIGALQTHLIAPGTSIREAAECANRLAGLGQGYRATKLAIDSLEPFLRDEARGVLVEKADRNAADLLGLVERLREGLSDFDTLQAMDDAIEELNEIEAKVYRHVRKSGPQMDWNKHVRDALVNGWLAEVEQESRALRRVSSGEVLDLRQQFRANLARRRELNRKWLALQLQDRATEIRFEPDRPVDGRHSAEKPWKDLKYQVGKKRRLWPLRKLVHDLRWPLLDVMPCWLVSPETLSASFPLEPGLFDLAIFDEASQLAVQYGIPALYRAKRIVIAGDEQQLRPFDLFGALGAHHESETDEEADEQSDAASVESESVLTLAKARFPEALLACHYRSRYEELIEFSNQGFYQGRLLTVPPADGIGIAPIEWRKVNGRWEQRRNSQEAAAVLDLLFELLKKHGATKNIGVITFNSTQQAEIEDQLDKRSEEDPEFGAVITTARNPESGNKDAALFVKNIENVQGDERDIIVFSIGYAPDANGRVNNRFGSLGTEGGDNRLNVAISRAREKIFVCSSIEPEQLSVATAKNRGPRLLRSYLEYAKAVSVRAIDQRDAILRGVNPARDVKVERSGHFDSPLEEQIYEELTRRNMVVRPQVGVSGYRIDLGIVDPEDSSRYLLGIECDGATYHSAHSVRERDAYRQRFLESRGWTIHRIWSRNWWRDKQGEIKKLEDALAQLTRPKRKD